MAHAGQSKVLALGGTLLPDWLYYQKGPSDAHIRLFVTGTTGTAFEVKGDVLGTLLAGYSAGANIPIESTDNILQGFQKTQGQINNLSALIAGGIKNPIPIDCSGNPNYPAGEPGDSYIVTVAGRIGGALGEEVEVGDLINCLNTNPGGTELEVGDDWYILNTNTSEASDTVIGIVRRATIAEVDAGTDVNAYVSAGRLQSGVRVTPLTGLSVGSSTAIVAGDSVIVAMGKIQAQINNRVVSNSAITAGTHAKITYDAKGLVTGGANLAEADIPSLAIAKITGLQTALNGKISGAGADGQVSFWNGTGSQAGDTSFIWNNTNKKLILGADYVSNAAVVINRNNPFIDLVNNGTLAARIGDVGGADDGILQLFDSLGAIKVSVRAGGTSFVNNGFNFGFNTDVPTQAVDINGNARIRTLLTTEGDFVQADANGVMSRRTAAQVAAQIGGNYVTVDGTQTVTGVKTFKNNNAGGIEINRDAVNTNAAGISFLHQNVLSAFIGATGTEFGIRSSIGTIGTSPFKIATATGNTALGQLTVNTVPARATAGVIFLTTESGVVSSRTSEQVRADIGAVGSADLSGYVTLATAQTITGQKEFGNRITIRDSSIPITLHETGGVGAGSSWRIVNDANAMRFDASGDTENFVPYTTPIKMLANGQVLLGAQATGVNHALTAGRLVDTGTGLTGGGSLTADRTISLSAGSIASLALADSAVQPAALSGYVPTSRTLTAGAGIAAVGDLSANRTISLTGLALAFHSLASNGFAVRTAAGTAASRTITGSDSIEVTNGDGVAGNPVIKMQWGSTEW